MKTILLIILTILSLGAFSAEKNTDSEIQLIIVQQNLKGFGGECPCPYYKTAEGKVCGDDSTYSQTQGETPKCYHFDVTEEEIQRYREIYGE